MNRLGAGWYILWVSVYFGASHALWTPSHCKICTGYIALGVSTAHGPLRNPEWDGTVVSKGDGRRDAV